MNIEEALKKVLGFDSKTFIEKAVEGGWNKNSVGVFGEEVLSNAGKNFKADVFLDPLAWQAVGKVEGWKETLQPQGEVVAVTYRGFYLRDINEPEWKYNMHRFIDVLNEDV